MRVRRFLLGLVVMGLWTFPADTASADQSVARKPYPRNVAIVIWDGAEVLDWAGPSEVFASASQFGAAGGEPAFRVYTVSRTRDPIVSQRFVDVVPDYSIEDAPRPDILVLPGGGTNSVLSAPDFLEWATSSARQAEVALSVCTGAFVLGRAGLLDGKDVTTWYGATDRLAAGFPLARVQTGRRFVDNGSVVTTAGVSAGIDGSLHVVARLLGRYVADRTAEYMEYRWTPEPYLAQRYAVLNPSLDERGRRVQQAEMAARRGDLTGAIDQYQALLDDSAGAARIRYDLAHVLFRSGRFADAARAFVAASAAVSLTQSAHYGAACSYARLGDSDAAFAQLGAAVAAGFSDASQLAGDGDLESIRSDPRFETLVAGLAR